MVKISVLDKEITLYTRGNEDYIEKTRTIAIQQMKLLVIDHGIRKLEDKK